MHDTLILISLVFGFNAMYLYMDYIDFFIIIRLEDGDLFQILI
jgi:hypothetical protein